MLGEELGMDLGDLAHEARPATPPRRGQLDRLGAGQLDRAGDRDPQLGERVEPRRLEARAPAPRISSTQVRDVARHRPGVVEARRERKAALDRDQAVSRLEADDAAPGRRDPDRAAGVGARAPPSASPAASAAALPPLEPPATRPGARVRDGAVVRVLRGDPVGELVQVRLAGVASSRRASSSRDRRGGPLRDVVAEDAPSRRSCVSAGGVEEVLDRERASRGPAPRAGRGRSRVGGASRRRPPPSARSPFGRFGISTARLNSATRVPSCL